MFRRMNTFCKNTSFVKQITLAFFLLLFNAPSFFAGKALKVLFIVPNHWYSHLAFGIKLGDILAESGHDVHFIVPITDSRVPLPVPNKVRLRHYQLLSEGQREFRQTVDDMPYNKDLFGDIVIFSRSEAWTLFNVQAIPCLDMARNQTFLEELRRERYDVALGEIIDICTQSIFHLANVPTTIVTSPVALIPVLAHHMGIPMPIYVPNLDNAISDAPSLSYSQRIWNLYDVSDVISTHSGVHQQETNALRELYGPRFPSIGELVRKASFVFVNVNEHLDIGRPISAKIKRIGGVAVPTVQPLEPRLVDIVRKSKNGIIIFSFGSIVETAKIPREQFHALAETFGHRFSHFDTIWRIAGPMDENSTRELERYPTIHQFPWFDQNSLLAQNKTVLMVSHCGLNSVNEAAKNGVPLVCVPMFGDQTYNTACVKHNRVGLALDKKRITVESLSAAVNEVLNNKMYSENIRKVARKLALAPFSVREVFVRNVEYAAAFPNDHFRELNLHGAELNFWQYFSLDFLLVPIVAASIIAFSATFYCWMALAKNKKQMKKCK